MPSVRNEQDSALGWLKVTDERRFAVIEVAAAVESRIADEEKPTHVRILASNRIARNAPRSVLIDPLGTLPRTKHNTTRSMNSITKNAVVTLRYVLQDPDGQVIDSSAESGPLTYLHGTGAIVPGLEDGLEGHVQGEHLHIAVPPERAYGFHDPDRVDTLPVSVLDPSGAIEVGMMFESESENGIVVATVTAIEGQNAKLDANHPLAGVELHFDVDIVLVRDATEEEIAHGHPHGEGGHEH